VENFSKLTSQRRRNQEGAKGAMAPPNF